MKRFLFCVPPVHGLGAVSGAQFFEYPALELSHYALVPHQGKPGRLAGAW